jgi:DNA modification methylase
MEEVEAVGNLRAATAVFRAEKERWLTDGRAIFNLSPDEAIDHFGDNLIRVGHEAVGARS